MAARDPEVMSVSSQVVEDDLRMIAEELRLRSEEITAEEISRGRRDAPDFYRPDDPSFVSAYLGSVHGHLKTVIAGISGGRDLPRVLPTDAVEEARATAQLGISLESLAHTYRTGHAVIWETVMDIADERIPSPERRSSCLRLVSHFLFAYTDRMLALISEVYERERNALFRAGERRKRQIVRDLLDGLPVDHSSLGYHVNGTHVGVVVWGSDPERAIPQVAQRLGCQYLAVPGAGNTVWGWLCGKQLADRRAGWRGEATPPPGTFFAFGDPAPGISGFRSSHDEARHAYRIASKRTKSATHYRDIALLALITQDGEMARTFMDRELGFLAEVGPRAAELRDTLEEYFACGNNASAAGAALGVHDRTVAYRLRTVEERLGHPITERRDELAIALRLFRGLSQGRSGGQDDRLGV